MASVKREDLVCANCFKEPRLSYLNHKFCLACSIAQRKDKWPEPNAKWVDKWQYFSRQYFRYPRILDNPFKNTHLNQEPLPVASSEVDVRKEDNELLKSCSKQNLVPTSVIYSQRRGLEFLPTKSAVKHAKACTEENLRFISREFEVLHQMLNEKEQDLKKSVEEVEAEKVEEMDNALLSLEKEVSSYSKLNAQIKTALEIADDFTFLKDFKELMDRIKAFDPQAVKDDNACVREEKQCDEVQSNEENRENGVGKPSEEELPEEKEEAAGEGDISGGVNWSCGCHRRCQKI